MLQLNLYCFPYKLVPAPGILDQEVGIVELK
jgi:hypothetical protein